jgi:hypothetical protein
VLLQQTVLMHFGTKSDDMDHGEDAPGFPKMEKLDRRMSKIKQKEADAAAVAAAEKAEENKG